MTCATCGDFGMVILNWSDAPADFGVCLCAAGQAMRTTENNGHTVTAQWEVWCARWQVDPMRVYLLEDAMTAEDLRERGLTQDAKQPDREAALLAAGKKRKR